MKNIIKSLYWITCMWIYKVVHLFLYDLHVITQISNALYRLYDNPKKIKCTWKKNIKHVIRYLAYTDLHLIKSDPNEDRLNPGVFIVTLVKQINILKTYIQCCLPITCWQFWILTKHYDKMGCLLNDRLKIHKKSFQVYGYICANWPMFQIILCGEQKNCIMPIYLNIVWFKLQIF